MLSLCPPGRRLHEALEERALAMTNPINLLSPVPGVPLSGLKGVASTVGSAVGGAVGSAVGGAALSAGAGAVFAAASSWVGTAAVWLLRAVGKVMLATTHPGIGTAWFASRERLMAGLAAAVIVPMLCAATIQAVYRQSVSGLLRSFLVNLPLALVLSGASVVLVRLGLAATDAMSSVLAGSSGADTKRVVAAVSGMFPVGAGPNPVPQFVVFLGGLLVCAAALMLWLELMVRAAAISAATLFLPLVLAALVWPAVSHWCRRLADTLGALVLSKLVIVAVLALGVGALAGAGSGGPGQRVSSAITGIALLVLAGFLPFTLLRIVPMVEAGAVAHFEGVRQRAGSAVEAPLHATAATAARIVDHFGKRAASQAKDAGAGLLGGAAGGLGGAPGGGLPSGPRSGPGGDPGSGPGTGGSEAGGNSGESPFRIVWPDPAMLDPAKPDPAKPDSAMPGSAMPDSGRLGSGRPDPGRVAGASGLRG